MRIKQDGASRVGSRTYRCYVAAQAVSMTGTSMGYAALYWLTIHLAHGRALFLSALVATLFLPMFVASRQAVRLGARPAQGRSAGGGDGGADRRYPPWR